MPEWPTSCEKCGKAGETHHSEVAKAWVCLSCHLRAAETDPDYPRVPDHGQAGQ